MINLLYTSTSYLPAIGGAQLHTHQLVKRMARDHTVQVVSHWDQHRTDWLWGVTFNAPAQANAYQFEGVPVQQLGFTGWERARTVPAALSYYLLKPHTIHQLADWLVPKIAPFAVGCALIHNARIGREPLSYASYRLARQNDVPFVFVPYHHPRWVGWRYREYIALYQQADAVIALTEQERQILADLGVAETKLHVLGNGPVVAETSQPDKFRYDYRIPADAPLVLFLGQKYRYKGFMALAEAAQIVWQRFPEAHFLFIGPQTRQSRRFFKAYEDEPRVIELGTVGLQTKTDALAACDLLCLPSTQESFGGVFTEAWQFSKPVIGGDIPAIHEVVDDGVNGYLVAQQAEAIADRIIYLLDQPQVAAQLGQAGYEKNQQVYNWDKLAAKMAGIYEDVIG